MLLVMLLGAMNYSNSMAFMLTFLLAGLGLLCMHHTHANLANLQMRAGVMQPVFAGETAHVEIRIDNPSAQTRLSIGLSWPRQDVGMTAMTDVQALQGELLRLPLPAPRRGWLRAGVFSVSTEYPLGLFHAWTWAELDITTRSEEHTSELQSLMRISYAVFCLKKKNQTNTETKHQIQQCKIQ